MSETTTTTVTTAAAASSSSSASSPASTPPTSTPSPAKRAQTKVTKPAPEGDHRKRRRNRTTQSCLNCHTSKRMCDRQRPCGRCTQLGLTGLCVYEIDDPQRNDASDEAGRLQRRVAELEGLVRELKNKPHPRWAQTPPTQLGHEKWHMRAKSSRRGSEERDDAGSMRVANHHSIKRNGSPSSLASSSSPSMSHSDDVALMARLTSSSSGATTPASEFMDDSPIATEPSQRPGATIDFDLTALLSAAQPSSLSEPPYFGFEPPYAHSDHRAHPSPLASTPSLDHEHVHGESHCGCLSNIPEYHAMLELSLRLRKAADTLRRSTRHRSHSDCALLSRISTWDSMTTQTLGNILTPPDANLGMMPQAAPLGSVMRPRSNSSHPPPPYPLAASSPTSVTPLAPVAPWDMQTSSHYMSPLDESLMAWEASIQQQPWPQQQSATGHA